MADGNVFAFCYRDPGRRLPRLTCKELRHDMAPYSHDIVEAWIQSQDDTDVSVWDTGVPIHFEYGRSPNEVVDFYGYVLSTSRNWVQNEHINSLSQIMHVHAVGASWVMKDGYQEVWKQVTAPNVAQQLAQRHYFTADAPPDNYVWPALHAGATTEWKFLCDLAHRSGRTCYVHGTELRFYDSTTPLLRNQTVVPTFYEKDGSTGNSVISFQTDHSRGSSAEGRRQRVRVLHGHDAYTGALLQSTTVGQPRIQLASRYVVPTFMDYETDIVVRSQADAQALLPAAEEHNRFPIRASAVLAGNPHITQESPIVLEGLGPRDSGIWQVLNARNVVKWQYWATEADLGRDSDFDNGVRPGRPANVARAQYDASQQLVFSQTRAVLSRGLWRSATPGALLG